MYSVGIHITFDKRKYELLFETIYFFKKYLPADARALEHKNNGRVCGIPLNKNERNIQKKNNDNTYLY